MAFEVVNELSRRKTLELVIDQILRLHLKSEVGARVKKGLIHNLVCDSLEVKNSSRLRSLVNERMALLGYPHSILHGVRFYRNAAFKGENVCPGL